MILLLSSQDVNGQKPTNQIDLARKCPQYAALSAAAQCVYVEGAGFIKNRFDQAEAVMSEAMRSLANVKGHSRSEAPASRS
jgi:hypothetical protein